LHSIS